MSSDDSLSGSSSGAPTPTPCLSLSTRVSTTYTGSSRFPDTSLRISSPLSPGTLTQAPAQKHLAGETAYNRLDMNQRLDGSVFTDPGQFPGRFANFLGEPVVLRPSAVSEQCIQRAQDFNPAGEPSRSCTSTGTGVRADFNADSGERFAIRSDDVEIKTRSSIEASSNKPSEFSHSDQHHIKVSGEMPHKISQTVGSIKDATRVPSTQLSRGGTSPLQGKSAKEREKKSMLSQALQKANVAVSLDNAQDYRGAVSAYEEACEFLNRVMGKTSNEEDRRKLKAIRSTYMTRVDELRRIDAQTRLLNRFLPEEIVTELPERQDTSKQAFDDSQKLPSAFCSSSVNRLHEQGFDADYHLASNSVPLIPNSAPLYRSYASFENYRSRIDRRRDVDKDLSLASLAVISPSPLAQSPIVPTSSSDTSIFSADRHSHVVQSGEQNIQQHDQMDYSAAKASHLREYSSRSSSHDSLSFTADPQGRFSQYHTADVDSEPGAALDVDTDAIKHNEGFEQQRPDGEGWSASQGKVALKDSPIQAPLHGYNSFARPETATLVGREEAAKNNFSMDSSADSSFTSELGVDEEERILEEVTREFMLDNHTLDEQAKSALPRQLDQTFRSNQSSAELTKLNSHLPTVTSVLSLQTHPASTPSQRPTILTPKFPPPTAPPTTALPKPPQLTEGHVFGTAQNASVQDRRFSGQKIRKLQIRTAIEARSDSHAGLGVVTKPREPRDKYVNTTSPTMSLRSNSTNISISTSDRTNTPNISPSGIVIDGSPELSDYLPHTEEAPHSSKPGDLSAMAVSLSKMNDAMMPPRSHSTTLIDASKSSNTTSRTSAEYVADPLTKEVERPLSMSDPGDIHSPAQSSFGMSVSSLNAQRPTSHSMGSLSELAIPADNVRLFTHKLQATQSSRGQRPQTACTPQPLEPCPTSTLLRPFWLLRCIYQTLSHPRGGYITTRLFIPREVWKVKNVRLKCIDDKIAACELLTSALLQLGAVDTLDADAVLEEMQALEAIMDEAQANLSKRLGNDVGVQNISSLFKDAPQQGGYGALDKHDPTITSLNSDVNGSNPLTGSFGKSNGKTSYLSSWRKLRSKSSNASLTASFSSTKDIPRDSISLNTLPMTSDDATEQHQRRIQKGGAVKGIPPDVADLGTLGPNAGYMAALTRLCDAVQVLDDIARQVEDPGLQKSSPTYVGLELSARHASEFFGFFICRFVLQDLTLLAERFLTRASEWATL